MEKKHIAVCSGVKKERNCAAFSGPSCVEVDDANILTDRRQAV
ncbi:unnamed protein product [Ixodes persulcatus]